ncbi:hypothetical protein MTP99_017447 [Tenebrio molitor]|nr:hypothetical protein MTP99_017447 [Tenebrio molitor]
MDEEQDLREAIFYNKSTTEETVSTILKPETRPKSINTFLYLTAVIADLMAFAAGVSFAWSSPMLPKLDGSKDPDHNPLGRPITPSEASWIAGLVPLGAIFGPMAAGTLADKIGRKGSLLVMAAVMTLSLLTTAFAKIIHLFYISRFLLGTACGSVFSILPLFLVEIAESHNRGTVSCLSGIFVTSGFNFAFVVGPHLSVQNFCLVCISPLVIFLVCFSILGAESPVYLASINDEKRLMTSLKKLRNNSAEEIQAEFRSIMKSVEQTDRRKGMIGQILASKRLRRALVISLGIIIFQQAAGVSAIISYMQTIFAAAGGSLSPEMYPVIVGTVQTVATALASSLVDRLGRKVLLLASAVGMCISVATLGVYFYLKNHQIQVDMISWVPVLSLVVFMMMFNIGLGPVPWVVIAELFPPKMRSTTTSLASFSCFMSSFIITLVFAAMSLHLGMANCFFVLSLICFCAGAFIFCFVPETKGKSLQAIQRSLEGNTMD